MQIIRGMFLGEETFHIRTVLNSELALDWGGGVVVVPLLLYFSAAAAEIDGRETSGFGFGPI